MTHQKILALLDGCSSIKPMPFAELAEKSGLLPNTLRTVLEQMRACTPSAINSATITRSGKTQEVYWPTGIVQPSIRQSHAITYRQPAPPPRREEAQAQITKEKHMTAKQPISRKNVLDYVTANPGATRVDVEKAFTHANGNNRKTVVKCISNAIFHGVIKQTQDGDGVKHLHPRDNTALAKIASDKPVIEKAAPHSNPAPMPVRKAPVTGDQMSLMVDEDSSLYITIGNDVMRLNADQVARITSFAARVMGAPA